MNLLGVYPADVRIVLEFSVNELEQMIIALDISTINFDGKDEKQVKSVNFLTKEFYPAIQKVIEDIKEKDGKS